MQIDPSVFRLLIADDHPIFREALAKLLTAEPGFHVIGQAGNGAEAVRLARNLKPDVLLLDLAMPGLHGLAALRELAAASPLVCRIVLLTAAVERAQILEALRLGARGVVLKESTPALLIKSIRCVMADQYWVGHEAVADLVDYLREWRPAGSARPTSKNFGLTAREMQIVETVAAGCTNKDIARQFSLSEDTVKHHLSSIFDKVGVSNRLELALFAIHHKLVEEQ
jgi:DNA-binding NarL/FixJ family response regulator